jgi:hypothetical protein
MRTAATAEVSAADSVAAAPSRGMAAGKVTAATATTVTPAAAAMLRKRGRCRQQYRPQNAGREKQAFALGTHDCHLPLRFAPLRELFEPINFDPTCITRFRLFGAQQLLFRGGRTAT